MRSPWPYMIAAALLPLAGFAQKTYVVDSTNPNFRTVIAGPQYKRGAFHNFFWGTHYRKEWSTPVRVPVFNMDTVAGGLKPTEAGGGRQTKTLRLKDANGKQYVLRTIDKNYKGALPEIVSGTFIEDLANDQVSTAHPFAAVTIPGLADAAKIYHTWPRIVYVPYSPRLDSFNAAFGNTLALFEERPDDDQSDAANFGFSKNLVSTTKMLEKIREENDHLVDQPAFVRARLFDIFLGDWGRHEDQWRWASFDSDGYKLYRPVPRDRDQAYTRFDGLLVNVFSSVADLDHLQTFGNKIKDIESYNFPARNLDRRLTNEVTRDQWIAIAKDLQGLLTDAVIEANVHQLPPEMYAISGDKIQKALKQHRNDLVEYAGDYYDFISQDVEIIGSEQSEKFLITRLAKHETKVEIFDIKKDGEAKKKPFFSRTFHHDETEELRIYGLSGNDVFEVNGDANKIKLRLIGGIEKDSVVNHSASRQGIRYYDNPGNEVVGPVKEKISADTAINRYNYSWFKYNSAGVVVYPSYSNRRGIFLTAGYQYTRQHWRTEPFASRQALKGYYSITNNSFGGDYSGIFNQLIGKVNVLLDGSYDQKLDNYFLGIGNETVYNDKIDRTFYKFFSNEANATIDFNRNIDAKHSFGVRGIYSMVRIFNDNDKFFQSAVGTAEPSIFGHKQFGGGEVYYTYHSFNNDAIPTKGIQVGVTANYIQNLSEKSKGFDKYTGFLGFYVPITRSISLASRNGVATITGHPEFYQLNTLGGGFTLRGYFRQRFYGKSSAFNNNDLRWMFNVRSHLFNGKMGLIAFEDNGRVWNPGEDSEKWHMGYGGGVMIVPFNKLALSVYYGTSEELGKLHIRIGRFF